MGRNVSNAPRFHLAFLAALAGCALVGLGAAAPAQGDHPATGSGPGTEAGSVPKRVDAALGGRVTALPNGLYRVHPRGGPSLTTHGPDPEAEVEPNHGPEIGPGDPERPPVCATDFYQHVLYGRPTASPDNYASAKLEIQATMRRINAVLNEESIESGGPSVDYKVLCDGAGEVRVDQFTSDGTSFGSIVSAAQAAGFNHGNAQYTIFFDYDHPSICGVGSFESDEELSADNANNFGGDYGVTYDGCWNGTTTMHEAGHNQGAVQYDAPFSTGSGAHCWDENDVMCYSPDGGDLHQEGTVDLCTDHRHFDCGHDTYFDTAPESGEYLATHWNLGSALNRFIAFPGPVPPDGGPPPPGTGPSPPVEGSEEVRLVNRVPLSDVAAPAGGWRYYVLDVPPGRSRLKVALDGPQCAAEGCVAELDLYVRRGDRPTLSAFRCGPRLPTSDETCRIRSPRAGTWYVGVYSAAGSGGAPYDLTARHRR